MAHINQNKQKLFKRISRIKGQIEGIESSLNHEVDCAAFLHQIASVRGALDGLMSEALEGHIREHLGGEHDHSEDREKDLEQVISVLKTYLK